MVEITTMGDLRVYTPSGAVALRTRKDLALLVYLADNETGFKQREQLCQLLWGNQNLVRARHSLTQSLYSLRRSLPHIVIEKERGRIKLRHDSVRLDLNTFRALINDGKHEEALGLYNGDFLSAFWIPCAPQFEEWQLGVQRSVNRDVMLAAKKVMSKRETDGDWEDVEKLAGLILRLNEFDEDAHGARVLALAATGRKREALGAIEQIRTSSFDLPTKVVESWLTQVREGVSAIGREYHDGGRVALQSTFPLIGRDAQFLRLRQCWEASASGEAQTAVVVGAAGVGKTRLCEQLARLAVIRGGRVCIGSCYATERHVPFAGIIEAFRRGFTAKDLELLSPIWASALSELLPESFNEVQKISELDPVSGRRRLFEAVSVLVGEMARRTPCLIVIDDFHWADDTTCALLHYVMRRAADCRIMLLLAMRPEDVPGNSEVWTVIEEQRRTTPQQWIALQPLSSLDCLRIVDVWATRNNIQLSSTMKTEIVSRSGGYPFLLIELLKAAPMSIIDGESGDLPPPFTVQEFLRNRFRTLSRTASDLLGMLSVIGRDATFDVLRRAGTLSGVEVYEGLDELLQRGFINDLDGEIVFSHELVREVAYQSLPAFRRRQLHHQVARVLCDEKDIEPGFIADHFDQAGDKHLAYQYGLQAADASASKYAYAETEHYLRLCLSNARTMEEEVFTFKRLAELLLKVKRLAPARPVLESLLTPPMIHLLGRVELTRFRVQEAEVLAATGAERAECILDRLQSLEPEVAATNDPTAITMLYRLQIRLAHDAGNDELVLSAINQLLAIAGRFPESGPGIQALRIASSCMAFYLDSRQGWKSACDALTAAERYDNAELMVDVLGSHASAAYHRGFLQQAHQSSLQAISLAESLGAIGSRCKLLNDLGVILTERGNYDEARSALHEVLVLASQMDVPHELITANANLALVAVEIEEYEQANSHCRSVFELHARHQMDRIYVLALSILGLAALRRARLAEAKRCYRELMPEMIRRKAWAGDFSAIAETFLAQMEHHEGYVREALARLESAISRSKRVGATSRCRLQLEWACIASISDPQAARRVAVRVRRLAMRMRAKPLVERAEAMIDRIDYRSERNSRSFT